MQPSPENDPEVHSDPTLHPQLNEVDRKRAESDAVERLKLARSFLGSANRVVIGFVISMSLIVLQCLRELPPSELVMLWKLKRNASTHNAQLNEVKRSGTVIALQNAQKNNASARSKFNDELTSQRKELSVKLPLGGELPLPGRQWLPIPQLVLCAILLLYLQYCRRRHFRLVARAVQY